MEFLRSGESYSLEVSCPDLATHNTNSAAKRVGMVGGCSAGDRPTQSPSRSAGSPAVFFPNVGFQIGVATQASLHVGVDDSRMDSQHAHMRRSELELAGLNQGEPAERRRLGDAVQSHTGERQCQFRTSERRCDENNAGFPRREPVMLENRRRDPQRSVSVHVESMTHSRTRFR